MEKYNIIGHNTLNSWLLQFGKNPEEVLRKRYKKADQRLAAYKVITGESTMEEIARSMQIALNTVYGWVRKYQKDVQQKPKPAEKSQGHGKESDKAKQKEIEELKLKVAGLEMMIDIAEKELKIDIRKKPGTKQ